MLVLGMDGLDHKLLTRYIEEGRLPNFRKLAERGCFTQLGTSMPPQSPVAWSNFISGADPGTHQIWDFIHRKPNAKDPGAVIELYASTSDIQPDKQWYSDYLPETVAIPYTNWQMPTSGQKIVSLRKGQTFWDFLVTRGIETTIYRMPANYPPPVRIKGQIAPFRCLCGMGTPDVNGTAGEFICFQEDRLEPRRVDGGSFYPIRFDPFPNSAKVELKGPPVPFRRPPPAETHAGAAAPAPEPLPTSLDVTFARDPDEDSVCIRLGDQQTVVLRKGEWSGWLHFSLKSDLRGQDLAAALGVPASIPAMVKIYVKDVHPNLNVYFTPLNIDPTAPVNAISTPAGWSAEIAGRSGSFYTTGIPEDTKALRRGALDEDEFLDLVKALTAERVAQYHDALRNFHAGFLFFYFGHTDQLAHVFWRDTDPGHPGRRPEQGDRYATIIRDTYEEMDVHVGEALAALGENDTLIVMSDHGFSGFRRGLELNRWLIEQGFLAQLDAAPTRAESVQEYVDWSQTRAYAVGINSIYVNLAGREKKGIVPAAEKRAVMDEIARKLLELRDDDGTPVVVKVYVVEDEYPNRDPSVAPDLLVGYAHNYRSSWSTALGGYGGSGKLLVDNRDRWSGDHCIAHFLVPGVFLSNRRIAIGDPTLCDVAPTILKMYGIDRPAGMTGRDLMTPAAASAAPDAARAGD